MSVDSMRRVILSLREKNTTGEYKLKEVRSAIMHECGTDPRTITVNMQNLTELGYLKRHKRWRFTDTGAAY